MGSHFFPLPHSASVWATWYHSDVLFIISFKLLHVTPGLASAVACWCQITKLAAFQFVHYLVTCHVIKLYTYLVKTKDLIWKVLTPLKVWTHDPRPPGHVNVLFTLPTLGLEETSYHHSHHILHSQHKRKTSLSGCKLDTLSVVEAWKKTHTKPSGLCSLDKTI